MPDLPPISPPKEADLPFKRQPMVKWFHPTELARTGMYVVLSKLFGAYADNREIQALRPSLPLDGVSEGELAGNQPTGDYSDQEELWIDYVADLGDGFNSTYSIARLLAAETVAVDTEDGPINTQRGRVLIMGGDQVYPTAKSEEYQNRLAGPYRAALSFVDPAQMPPPHLYAVPGNHDWYDGLTSFTRLFCQGRWIGGWKTRQSRSYFALKLPHNWWLWGIDVQLGSDIDEPQLNYFRNLAAEITPGAKIILCVAEPTWLYTDREGIDAYNNLAVFEDKAIREFGHTHVIGLAGDLHAYARYCNDAGQQRFISGGGGAYLYPTHRFPSKITLPTARPTIRTEHSTATYQLARCGHTSSKTTDKQTDKALFPPPQQSFLYALKSLFFAWYNPTFAFFLGAYYLILAWVLQSASKALSVPEMLGTGQSGSFQEAAIHGFGAMIKELGSFLGHAPIAVAVVVLFAGGLITYADSRKMEVKWVLGLFHTFLHLCTFLGVVWLFMQIQFVWLSEPLAPLGDNPDNIGHALLFIAEMLIGGSVAAGAVWGLYLFLAHFLGKDIHSNDVLACQSIPDYKHIVRMHITKEQLTIYPIGLKSVPRNWTYRPGITNGNPWFVPQAGPTIPKRAHLIEPPVHLTKN